LVKHKDKFTFTYGDLFTEYLNTNGGGGDDDNNHPTSESGFVFCSKLARNLPFT
jgi:hypothetical protein